MTKVELQSLIKAKETFLQQIDRTSEVYNGVAREIEDMYLQLEDYEDTEELEDDITEEELLEKLKYECQEKGIEYHHRAGINKLNELLTAYEDAEKSSQAGTDSQTEEGSGADVGSENVQVRQG